MAIDRTGISSLQTGAPEIKYTGDEGPRSPDQQLMASADPMLVEEYQRYVYEMREQGREPISFRQFVQEIMSGMAYGGTAKPTYTQSRKQNLAYGGIAGLDGRKKYGIGSWIQEQIIDPVKKVIPNEIKNPAALATIAGLGLNQWGLPDWLVPDQIATGSNVGQNWIGNLLGGVMPGDTQFNTVIGDKIPFKYNETLSNNPAFGGIDSLAKSVGTTGNVLTSGGINPADPSTWEKANQLLNDPTGALKKAALDQFQQLYTAQNPQQSLLSKAKDFGINTLKNVFLPSGPETGIGTGTGTGTGQGVNWKDPLKYGLMIGALDAAMPKTPLPQDTSGIDIANIRSRALTGSDPDLHFLPPAEATTAYAQGGRIGYAGGTEWTADAGRFGEDPEFSKLVEDAVIREENKYWQKGEEPPMFLGDKLRMQMWNDYKTGAMGPAFKAQGGRIGYNAGSNYDAKIKELTDKGLSRELAEALVISELSPDAYTIIPDDKAQGGRIGAQEGGLMDLGGMEKDYRQEGGFVPIGGQERADDVPARLSKNEFVFTADAVRAAGGGDIDKGAEVMENVMNNLEQGGQVSEESQGLEGARDMFATAQRLEGVM